MNNVNQSVADSYFNLLVLTSQLIKKLDDTEKELTVLALGTITGEIGHHIFGDIETLKEEHVKWTERNPELAGIPGAEA